MTTPNQLSLLSKLCFVLKDSFAAFQGVHYPAHITALLPADLMNIGTELKLERATPHDLRRTALTTITRLGFGRDAMDRIANHKKGGITDVYDRHGYADEDQRIMAAVARHVLSIVERRQTSNVVALR